MQEEARQPTRRFPKQVLQISASYWYPPQSQEIIIVEENVTQDAILRHTPVVSRADVHAACDATADENEAEPLCVSEGLAALRERSTAVRNRRTQPVVEACPEPSRRGCGAGVQMRPHPSTGRFSLSALACRPAQDACLFSEQRPWRKRHKQGRKRECGRRRQAPLSFALSASSA